ncbi:hypothetical protein DFQ26_004055 [Actinomortierella ambigua]|nr:hypothetical protein DFQ26_004055 [Actinomortierella ambigua]
MRQAKLGSGIHGTVYKGRWGIRVVAAKLYHVPTGKRAQAAIKKEIATLERLKFRHVIEFYETVYHRGQLTVVTDLAEGGSLKAAIDKGLEDWATKERFAREMALGLAYIHSEGVLHLDLRSENVLLTSRMEVKLCDFGCATIKSSSAAAAAGSTAANSAQAKHGAVRWTAPELLVKQPMCSTKSDMYSLGMVMWEMAANCTTPFKTHHNDSAVISHVKEGNCERLPKDTPTQYRAWVEQCWNHDPSKRPDAIDYAPLDDERNGQDNSASSQPMDDWDDGTTKTARPPSTLLSDAESDDEVFFDCQDTFGTSDLPKASSKESHQEAGFNGFLTFPRLYHFAIEGDTRAKYIVGDMYRRGFYVEKNLREAAKWFLAAAHDGDVPSQRMIGFMFLKGEGIERPRPEAAVSWLLMAAQQEDAVAQYYLGMMYKMGDGVDQSDVEAFKWFGKAARNGNEYARHSIGEMLRTGRGKKQHSVDVDG